MTSSQGLVPGHMEHVVLLRRKGTYAAFPVLERLEDGRLAVALLANHAGFKDHYGVADWPVLTSADGGATWAAAVPDDASIPFLWPGSSPRERYDRFAGAMPDGTLAAAGAVGWEEWPAARADEAHRAGRRVAPHPSGDSERVIVGGSRLFVQRSRDGGRTWERREWEVPGAYRLNGFPRWTKLADGTILAPLYDHGALDDATGARNLVYRSADGGASWRPLLMGSGAVWGDEGAFVETAPGCVLALLRKAPPGYLLECWSDDGGRTWTQPVRTEIWGYPPHLLRLRDGRLLCSYGHRRAPLGVQTVLSADGGRTWSVEQRAVLRDDGETTDLGYPLSAQLADETIFTVYYITTGGVTHVAATRWELPW